MPHRRPHMLEDLLKITEGYIAAIDLTLLSAAWPDDVGPLLQRALTQATAAQHSVKEAHRRLAEESTGTVS
jgi:hypothetical protein